jgi:hypothetical protein
MAEFVAVAAERNALVVAALVVADVADFASSMVRRARG